MIANRAAAVPNLEWTRDAGSGWEELPPQQKNLGMHQIDYFCQWLAWPLRRTITAVLAQMNRRRAIPRSLAEL
jgi:hypothetical protein